MLSLTRLFLIRHGEVEDRYHRIFGGRIDMELSPRGHAQAEALAKFVRRRPLEALYCSPMRRALQTMAPLAPHCPNPAVVIPEFREMDFGDWTGLSWEEVHRRFGVSAFSWLEQIDQGTIPNAETGAMVRSRVEPALRQIVAQHAGQSVGIVCHGGVIRMLLSILVDMPLTHMRAFEIDYASFTHVEHHPRKTEVLVLNLVPWRDLS